MAKNVLHDNMLLRISFDNAEHMQHMDKLILAFTHLGYSLYREEEGTYGEQALQITIPGKDLEPKPDPLPNKPLKEHPHG